MIRLDTAFHAFVANDELAIELDARQNTNRAIVFDLILRNGAKDEKCIRVALVREDEPQAQLNDAENLLHL